MILIIVLKMKFYLILKNYKKILKFQIKIYNLINFKIIIILIVIIFLLLPP